MVFFKETAWLCFIWFLLSTGFELRYGLKLVEHNTFAYWGGTLMAVGSIQAFMSWVREQLKTNPSVDSTVVVK